MYKTLNSSVHEVYDGSFGSRVSGSKVSGPFSRVTPKVEGCPGPPFSHRIRGAEALPFCSNAGRISKVSPQKSETREIIFVFIL